MKTIKTVNKLLFILLAFSPIFGAEPEKEASKTSPTLETCVDFASVAGGEASKFGKSLFVDFCKEAYKDYFQKPLFKATSEIITSYVGKPEEISIKQKTVAGATLAALYVLYKWVTLEKGKSPDKQKVEVDIRPKSFKAFLILLLDKDSGVDLIKRFNYELQTIKKDLEIGNKQGLELLPLIYPDLISSLDATQRQYLNDLIKQVTETDTIIVVPVKSDTKPVVS